MKHINRQIISGFVNAPIKEIKGTKQGYGDGIVIFIDCKTSRESDKYDQRSVAFWGRNADIFRQFIDIVKNKQLTVIGKSIRNSVKKTCECGKCEYIRQYDQIKATDFCLGSVDLWKNPHLGEIYKQTEENVEIDSIVGDMFGEEKEEGEEE